MKSKIILIIIIIDSLFVSTLIFSVKAQVTQQFYPTADSFVSETFPDKIYGDYDYVCVSKGSLITYLKFDISPISEEDYVNSAQLKLKVHSLGVYESYVPNTVYMYYTSNNDWNEYEIKWNNKPNYYSESIDYAQAGIIGTWSEWDITNVTRELRKFTLVLTYADTMTQFYSRESEYSPILEVAYTERSNITLIQIFIVISAIVALIGISYVIIRNKRR